jgi:superfamily II DNA/RNA helicase
MEVETKKSVDTSLLETEKTFESFGFDDRLLKAIFQQGWTKPSLVQASAIPLALEGNTILDF